MANYVWTPFDSRNAGITASNLTLRGKIDRIHDLSSMSNDDVLYISAHHNKFLPHISDGESKMGVYELCDRLVDSGLKKPHKFIKLWICYGGYGLQQRQGFAYQFWYTMNKIYGFNNLTVFAYTEITVDPIFEKHKTCLAMVNGNYAGLPGTAKNYRVGIRANGDFIPPGQS
jgi:hypothetical protein